MDVKVGSRTLSLSNLEKVLWPRDGYTKGDLIRYYQSVAPWMVPHLRDRPLTLERYPNGIDASSFFEKQFPKGMPDWVGRVTIEHAEHRRTHTTYVVCNDAPSLVYLANLAAVILHIWTSRVESLEEPDFVLFDLDPGERCSLQTLATVALAFRDALAEIGLPVLVKTTGGYGVHVVVPLAAGYSYDTAKLFGEILAHRMTNELGKLVTLERMTAKRDAAAVYLDYVQVGRGKTIVAPYSVRARDGAPVSMPLDWSEVEAYRRKRTATTGYETFAAFNMRTAIGRLEKNGDLWSGRAWKKARLEPALEKAQKRWAG
ncbi:MAG TPA: non-homologous end-joining DNA ligase [Verrucomicrobiae bacterium]|nr:non-homologous end-joining DNA ligase [Verrucomicrobiae bacterium]